MVKFARDILIKTRVLRATLSEKLGPDTRDLDLRIGCMSGPVTAGILRGQKSRFQLFGDTVNTASRMESHGQPGRIHVSMSVAEHLMAKGKEHWLEAREDKVVAKGKGEMQTYWVNVGASPSASTSQSMSSFPKSSSDQTKRKTSTDLVAAEPARAEEEDTQTLEDLQQKLRARNSSSPRASYSAGEKSRVDHI